MSEKYQDCYYKMAKKIAQLTKVIFQLHTQNLESEELLTATRRGYEREIDSIVHSADEIIKKQKEAIQQQAEGKETLAKLQQLQTQAEVEKQAFLKDFELYKKTVAEQELKMTQTHEEQLKKCRTDLETMRLKYEQKITEACSQLKSMEGYKKSVEELRRLHKTELENHVKEHNRKYNELVKAKMTEEERLREAFSKEKAELVGQYEKKLADALSKLTGDERHKLDSALQQQRKELEDAMAKLKKTMAEKLAAAETVSKGWETKTKEAEERNKELMRRAEEEGRKSAELQKELERLKTDNASIRKDHERSKDGLQTELDKLMAKMQQQLESINELRNENTGLKQKLNDATAKSIQDNAEFQETLHEKSQLIEQLEFANRRLQQRVVELEQSLNAQSAASGAEKDGLLSQVAKLEKEIAQIKLDAQNELSISLRVLNTGVTEPQETEGRVRDLEAALERQMGEYEGEIRAAKAECAASLNAAEDSHKRQLEDMKKQWQEDEEKLVAQHRLETQELRSQIEQYKAAFTSQTEQVRDGLERTIAELKAQMLSVGKTHKEELGRVKSSLESAGNELQAVRAELLDTRQKLEEATKELETKEEKIARLKERLESIQKKHEKELQKLAEGYKGNQQEWETSLQRRLEVEKQKLLDDFQVQAGVTKAKTDQKMAEMRYDYEKLLRSKEAAAQAALAEKKAEIDKLQDELAQRNLRIVELKDAHEKEMNALEAKHRTQLQETTKKHAEQMDQFEQLKQDWAARFKQEHVDEMKKASDLLQKQFDDKLQQQKDQAEAAIHALTLKTEHTIRVMQEERGALESELKAKMQIMKEDFEKKEHDLRQNIEALVEDLSMTQQVKKKLEKQLAELIVKQDDTQRALIKANTDIEHLNTLHHDELRTLLVKKSREFADAEAAHKTETEKLVKEHLAETEELQRQFAGVQELLEKKYRQLEEKYLDGDLYDTRPSRNEDLEMIRQLQEQGVIKDNMIKKAAEDMKFYKLELLNREESYNKVFGAKPVVGIFNPLEKEKKETAGSLKENLGTAAGKRKKLPQQ